MKRRVTSLEGTKCVIQQIMDRRGNNGLVRILASGEVGEDELGVVVYTCYSR